MPSISDTEGIFSIHGGEDVKAEGGESGEADRLRRIAPPRRRGASDQVIAGSSRWRQFQPAILLASTSTCSIRGAPANSSPALDIKAEAI